MSDEDKYETIELDKEVFDEIVKYAIQRLARMAETRTVDELEITEDLLKALGEYGAAEIINEVIREQKLEQELMVVSDNND